MNKILVDTSVWIDALNGRATKGAKLLAELIERDAPIVTCPIIIQEILQGFRNDEDFKKVKEILSGFELLVIDPIDAAYGAAMLYRDMRKKGISIRKSNDCLIAFFAIYNQAQLLHNDADFNRIAKHSSLKIVVV